MSVNYKACKDKKFVNPYSFIELINNELRDNARIEHGNEQKLYGYIECKIKTKTPLAILGNCSKGTDGHKVYDFFRVNGKPTIPGSSVRAMIRMAYETLTDSCLVTLKDNYAITERVSPKDAFKPGVLVRDGDNWALYEAERIRLNMEENATSTLQTGDYVKLMEGEKGFCISNLCKDEDKNETTKHVFVIGENKKNKKSVFKFDKNNKVKLDNHNDEVKRAIIELDYIVEMYQNKSINKKYEEDKGWYKTYWKEKENGVIPVWYKVIGNKLYLSKAAIGRKVFKKTVNELIDEQYRPCLCNERESLCPACSLFGTARGKGNGSKIRVTDAISEKDIPKDKIILRELSSPHIGYYLFYGKNGKTYDDNKATIAGRKYYWHIPKVIDEDGASIYSTDVKNERNCSCELVPINSEFSFKVYFDGITKKQLNQLMWAINMGENDPKGNICHRLGYGKPLGLGSVKVVIDKVTYREYTNGQYKLKDGTQVTEDLGFNNCALNDLKLVSDFTFMKDMEVKYPEVIASRTNDSDSIKINDVAAHKWFLNNKKKLEPIKYGKEAKDYQFSAIELDEKLKEDNSNKKGSKGNRIKIEVGMRDEFKVDLNTSNERFIKLKNSDGLMASVPYRILKKELSEINDGDKFVLECIENTNAHPKWKKIK